MSTADLYDMGYGGIKEPDLVSGPIGDSTNLPQNWFAFQESLWETLTFQRNINVRWGGDSIGMSLAIQCSDRKAQDISKSDMQLWRRVGRGWELVKPKSHWLADLLARKPNDFHTWDEFWRMLVIHFDIAQNAYVLKDTDRAGRVRSLLPLPTARVRPQITDTGRLFYEIAGSTEFERAAIGGDLIRVPANRIIHLKGRMWNGITGMSNIQLGAPLFDLIGAISKYQTSLFGNDGRQPIVFESDSAVFGVGDQADAAFTRLKNQLTERVRRMNAYGDPILLEAGYKAKVVAQSAREAMTTEAYESVVRRVCGLMNMMPHKIFAYEGVKYDNQAAADNQYANQCLFPITTAIEKRFLYDLLDENEWYDYYPEFDQLPLIAGDAKTMMELVDKGLKSGVMTFNEAREVLPLNLNPMPGGDYRMVPVNMAMVDKDGEVIQPATGQPLNDGQTPAPVDPEQAAATAKQHDLVAAVKAGVEAAAARFPKPAQPDDISGPAVVSAIKHMGESLIEAIKSAPLPAPVSVPSVSIMMPKRRKEKTTVTEHDADGRIKSFIKEEVEE